MNEIKIILNLPRSGGTIISKAISSQKDVVLLSEIHPDGPKIRKIMGVDPDLGDPIFQFHNWYDFIEKKEYKKDLYSDLKFLDKIKIIYQTTKDKNNQTTKLNSDAPNNVSAILTGPNHIPRTKPNCMSPKPIPWRLVIK